MPQEPIERREIAVDIGGNDLPPEYDPRFVNICRATKATLEMYEQIEAAFESGRLDPADPPDPITQEYVDELAAAIRCFSDLVDREDYEAVKRDVSMLDDETLAEVRATTGYVAPHFGVDLELPAPDGSA